MSKRSIDISIVIATFNSAQTLPLVLNSIKKQTYPPEKIETLIVDGGSTDKTIEIAQKFNCRILANPKTIPFIAKCIGTAKAKGMYILYLDADEVLLNSNSLLLKYEIIESNKRVKAVIGSGYEDPKKSSIIRTYINEFGDPFSFFVYRLSKNSKYFIKQMLRRYPLLVDKESYVVFDYSCAKQLPLIELGAVGSMVDLKYVQEKFPKFTYQTFAHLFYLLNSDSKQVAITRNDVLMHFSSNRLKEYLNKIRWRVKNNIYHESEMGVSGFSGRDQYQAQLFRLKKYFFIPYVYLMVFPMFDSIYLAVTRKKWQYLIHFPLCLFTANLITYHYFLKLLGKKQQLRSYDESRVIKKSGK